LALYLGSRYGLQLDEIVHVYLSIDAL
jgi:hypothetical protein